MLSAPRTYLMPRPEISLEGSLPTSSCTRGNHRQRDVKKKELLQMGYRRNGVGL